MNQFAYIVTCHNCESMLPQVLGCIQNTWMERREVVCVIDGCSDCSKKAAQVWGATVIETPDVHEIKSINEALKYLRGKCEYAITVQDDVLLQDPELESLTLQFFEKRPKLAHLAFRMGSNYTPDFQNANLCENVCGYGFGDTMPLHTWAPRMVICKSPSVIPMWAVEKFGALDERLCPRSYDDVEFSLRMLQNGHENIVLATKWTSKLEWGGTRRFSQDMGQDVRNADYVKSKYHDLLHNFTIPEEYKHIYGLDQL